MRKNHAKENYLERIPEHRLGLPYQVDEAGIVVLEQENRGLFHTIAQKLWHKPKISYIHLDRLGSFLWLRMDGEKNLITLGEELKEHFGPEAEPLYPRLVQYVRSLEDCGFIEVHE